MLDKDTIMADKIIEKSKELESKYPIIAAYESRSSLWTIGRNQGLVSNELYTAAREYYGRLWNYIGD